MSGYAPVQCGVLPFLYSDSTGFVHVFNEFQACILSHVQTSTKRHSERYLRRHSKKVIKIGLNFIEQETLRTQQIYGFDLRFHLNTA